ncbi:uncharacterized protein BO66DRAFT_393966 [Aspergillus aculeatinus CBS 121060]|uniref:Uncharacterized protein n=1 Tax=Aspergillus aculeatinus CBS 121060 TaxID=1448322 RepID=A0ACD1H0P7_9EURO|nr:hypothetical protein BO66DRAFT_393966 [Aspergillus aculeatinus CBS 121060]RAH67170.1 hypothetical protein BO66DRAFT_393966 [Aspergillus aculeatinus CBS 121060]
MVGGFVLALILLSALATLIPLACLSSVRLEIFVFYISPLCRDMLDLACISDGRHSPSL